MSLSHTLHIKTNPIFVTLLSSLLYLCCCLDKPAHVKSKLDLHKFNKLKM